MNNLKTRCKCYRGIDSVRGNSFILVYLEVPVSIPARAYHNCFEFSINGGMLPWPKYVGNRLLTIKDSIYDEENYGPTMDFMLYPVFIYHIGYNSDLEYLSPLDSNLVSGLMLAPLNCTNFVALNWDSPRDQFAVTSALSLEDPEILPVKVCDMIPGGERGSWDRLMALVSKFRARWIEYDI